MPKDLLLALLGLVVWAFSAIFVWPAGWESRQTTWGGPIWRSYVVSWPLVIVGGAMAIGGAFSFFYFLWR